MLRGTLVIWAGILTIVLLKRRLHSHHWFGMVRRQILNPLHVHLSVQHDDFNSSLC